VFREIARKQLCALAILAIFSEKMWKCGNVEMWKMWLRLLVLLPALLVL
jgi:hypothetical protein